ncbi:hypothetical protein NHQ30_003527 [Ciborinia camelliae]|nr:hypothetical protein NHQ30_003527 [Ciborinia camelliae]
MENVSFRSCTSVPEPPSAIRNNLTPQSDRYRFEWGDDAALSYVWGVEPDTEIMFVNGVEMKIRLNLAAALKSIVKDCRFEERFGLGVDALCINQHDAVERGHQVGMMKDLFSMAWNVISWIGEEANESLKAMQLLEVLSENRDKEKADGIKGWSIGLAGHDFGSPKSWSWAVMQSQFDAATWLSIGRGLSMELKLFIVISGKLKMNFYNTTGSNRETNPVVELDLQPYTCSERTSTFKALIDNRANDNETGTNVTHLLDITASCYSSDVRDTVYGMLAMMDPAITKHISPDYTITAKDISINVATIAFETYGNLELLREYTMWPPQQSPTWAPDWSYRGSERDGRPRRTFHASGSQACTLSVDNIRIRLT